MDEKFLDVDGNELTQDALIELSEGSGDDECGE